MAEDAPTLVNFQIRLTPDVYTRLVRQRDRWGMSNQELLTRILEKALPEWEARPGPPGTTP